MGGLIPGSRVVFVCVFVCDNTSITALGSSGMSLLIAGDCGQNSFLLPYVEEAMGGTEIMLRFYC